MIYVNNVSVYPSSITIKKGQFYNGAYAIVSPSNATCGCVEWSSDDIGVATVNWESGQIYGRSGGTARIYATATDGSGKRDYITVTVDDTVKITSIYTCPENMTLMVGDTETLSPIIYPSNATNKTLDWTTTNSSVASVSGGVVTAKAPGSAYIKATARDGSGKVGSTFVEVWGNVLVQSINVVPSSKTMNIGESIILSANVTPTDAIDSHVVWESTNPSVATVNAASGLVYAVRAGTTTIRAEAQDGSGVVGIATITVRANVPVTGITVCPETETLNVGESTTLQATVYPYNATNKQVTWCSSNEDVATVDAVTGRVQALSTGSAIITASDNSGHSGECCINVEALMKSARTEKTIFGEVINDVIGAQAYRVVLDMTYYITKINNGKVYIGEISAFTKYDKGNTAAGLNYPDITIGRLKIGNDTYTMQFDDSDKLLSPDWEWDAKVINVNRWYNIGTTISLLSIVMLDASLFPYRDVELETQISVS